MLIYDVRTSRASDCPVSKMWEEMSRVIVVDENIEIESRSKVPEHVPYLLAGHRTLITTSRNYPKLKGTG